MKIEYESSKLSVPADFMAARLGKGVVVPKHDPREWSLGPDPKRMPDHVTVGCPERLTKAGPPGVRPGNTDAWPVDIRNPGRCIRCTADQKSKLDGQWGKFWKQANVLCQFLSFCKGLEFRDLWPNACTEWGSNTRSSGEVFCHLPNWNQSLAPKTPTALCYLVYSPWNNGCGSAL